MRLFILQISKNHVYDGSLFDELYHFKDFNDLCAEFRNKLNYYKAQGYEMTKIEEPTLDEGDNEVSGHFKFVQVNGSGFREVSARVTDVHIED